MTPHLDDELLSAHLDGHPLSADEASHLGACRRCVARLSELRAVAQAVGQPVTLASTDRRQAHLAAALAEARAAPVAESASAPAAPVLIARHRPQRPAWLGVAAAIAVLAAAGLALAQLGGQATKSSATRAASAPSTAQNQATPGPATTATSGGASTLIKAAQLGDLGAQSDLRTLADAVQARVPVPSAAFATSAAPSAQTKRLALPACLDQATTDATTEGVARADPVYSAPVQWRGTAATVVAWAIPGPTATTKPSLRIEVMSLPGCQRLASLST